MGRKHVALQEEAGQRQPAEQVVGIAAAFGSVWVVNSEFDSGGEPSLSRIDPASATVVVPTEISFSSASRIACL